MQDQDNPRLREILAGAAELPPGQRGGYLDGVCEGDQALRREVESLLGHLEHEHPLLEQVTAAGTGLHADLPQALSPASAADGPGSRIGRYKLLQLIGEGGFGTVFMAEQEHPVRRRVALKIIKLGMDSKQVIARFEAERQALAMMDHPNIARVLDGGTTDTGRPYFVMDLVKGVPITEYCDSQNLPARQRLELFAQVCQAVQHAHQKGIIHRDLKPSNILVSLADGTPVPKVIDFGIAKATNARLTEQTYFTEFRQFIGTPQYMSPEQAEMSAIDIDTRSDIYSLGVLLYELLTGTTPLDAKSLRAVAYEQMRQMIREMQPPRPSTRLSTLGDTAAAVAKQRSTEPHKLGQLLRGELDWIVMKALEKDRTRRYETANGLALDIQRHLNNEPVLARPPSRMYAVQKFVSRHWVGAMAGSAVATALVIGLALATYGLVRARAETNRANIARFNEQSQRTIAEQEKQHAVEYARQAGANASTAERNAHETQVRLAEGWIAQADALSSSGKVDEAHSLYVAAYEKLRELHEPLTAAEIALWSSYRQRPTPILTYRGHTAQVNSVALALDGHTALSASDDKTIKVWDLPTGREVRSLVGHTGAVNCVVVSPDGHSAISGSSDGTLKLWDLESGSEIRTFKGHASDVLTIAITPDGKAALSGAKDGTLKLWELESGKEVRMFRGHALGVMCVAISPDGKTALSGGADGALRLWDLATGKMLRMFGNGNAMVLCIAFSPDGQNALSGGADRALKLWNIADGAVVATLNGHADSVSTVLFSQDGQTVISGSADRTIRVWNLPRRVEIRRLSGHAGPVTSMAAMHGSNVAVSSTTDGSLNLWKVDGDEGVVTFEPHAGNVYAAAIAPDGRTALSCGDDKMLKLWDIASGRIIRTLKGHTGQVFFVAYSPNGQYALSGGDNQELYLWDLDNGRPVRSFVGHKSAVACATFSPDGRTVLSTGVDATVRLWDVATGREIRTFIGHGIGVPVGHFTPNGQYALSGSVDKTLRLWDLASGKEIRRFLGHSQGIFDLSITPDGQRALSASVDGTLKLWDLASGNAIRTFTGHTDSVLAVAIFSDGQTALSGSNDKTLRLWDLATGKELLAITGHGGWIPTLDVSSDGKALSSSVDGTIKLWDFPHGPAQLAMEPRVKAAQDRLAQSSYDATALKALGEWFAFRGMDAWAAELLVRARDRGAAVSPLLVARCDVSSAHLPAARREYQKAMEQDDDARERTYISWCIMGLDDDPGSQQAAEPTSLAANGLRQRAERAMDIGDTKEAIVDFAAALARDPDDATLVSKLSLLQAWLGEDAELLATARRAVAHAENTKDAIAAASAARSACLRPIGETALNESALILARRAVEIGKDDTFDFAGFELTLGMAEYRCGHYAAANEALRVAAEPATANPLMPGFTVASKFYHAMSLFRQGNEAEARVLATDAAKLLRGPPPDERSLRTDFFTDNKEMAWMSCREALALLATDAKAANAK